jgi:hypothetical protein
MHRRLGVPAQERQSRRHHPVAQRHPGRRSADERTNRPQGAQHDGRHGSAQNRLRNDRRGKAHPAAAGGRRAEKADWNWRYMDTVDGHYQYSGPMWGTFTLDVDSGGTWEGSWTGHWDGTGDTAESTTLSFVGHGEGGDIDGMQIKMEARADSCRPRYWGGSNEIGILSETRVRIQRDRKFKLPFCSLPLLREPSFQLLRKGNLSTWTFPQSRG